jgi:hypothetical protein
MTESRIFKGALLFCAFIAFLFATRTASASALTYADLVNPFVTASDAGNVYVTDITLTGAYKVGTTEYSLNISSITPTFTAHNDNGGGAPGNANDKVLSATLYNDITGNTAGNCYVGEVLGYGQSCTIELLLTVTGLPPSKPTGDYSDNFGMNLIKVVVDSNANNKAGTAENVTAEFLTQVDYAPEPSSLLLLGSGMLGLAGVLRRKFKRV